MAILATGNTFATGDNPTAATLNAAVNSATFASGAVDSSTTQLSSGAIIVKDGGITAAKLSTGGPTWTAGGVLTATELSNTPIGSTTRAAGKFTTLSANNTTTLMECIEQATISASALTGTVNFDVLGGAVVYYTANAAANWTLNVRGDGSTSFDSITATGDSVTIAVVTTQGSTAYYESAFKIDGNSVTPKWVGAATPTAGNASSLDVYTYTIIKTASATFIVLASQTRFA